MRTALFWQISDSRKISCRLCPHHCMLGEGQHGRCGIRQVRNGDLQAIGYGVLSSAHVDPIEKKPLYHFLPGHPIFSIGGWGCNFSCRFCQNWTISQSFHHDAGSRSPSDVVQAAIKEDSAGIAYTYNEPLINIEFVHDCAELAKKRGLVNVLVTNGFIEPEPAAYLLPFISALNIDIKSMDDAFYRKQCGGFLAPVLRFAVQARKAGCHVEITNLLIPGLNDSEELAGNLSEWIAGNLGRTTPLHLSAYHPDFKMDIPPTPSTSLERAYKRCTRDLDYVYVGNIKTEFGADTKCPQCGYTLVTRSGYSIQSSGLSGRACARCGREADFVLEADERRDASG